MKYLLISLSILLIQKIEAQSYQDSIIELRVIHMGELIDSSKQILNQKEINQFEGLSYFEVDSTYRLQTIFTKSIGKKFKMPTSTDREPIYRRFGYIDFIIGEEKFRLTAYQNMALRKDKEHKKYLFIPFRDKTSGNETYGGGRYLDIQIPNSTALLIDFNLVYNPYCVYSHRYSCPIPPAENTLNIAIKAGEKVPVGYSSEH